MSDWSEDNFLERLAPQLRQKSGRALDPCPDAATLCAAIEGEARPPQRDAVMAHLARCAVCAELHSRLLGFEHEAPPEPEAVWNQTRTRLDNWLQGFLHQEARRSLAAQSGRRRWSFTGWESIASFFTPRRILWSLSAALVLVLIVDGALWLKYRQAPSPQGQVASRPGVHSTGGNKLPVKPESPQGPGVGGPGGITPLAGPTTGNLPTETAAATGTPPHNPASNPQAGPGNPLASAQSGPAGPPSTPRNAETPTVTRPLAKLWLNPTGRLLIVVSTVHFQPDGRFQFHGTLLLPVPQPGHVPLDKGAEVMGIGAMSQGQTSLTVTELDVQGVRFRLKEGTGDMNAETPGANGGVDFHVSQVLDMWPADAAVYEQVACPGELSAPPK